MAYTKVTGALVGSLSDLDLTNVGDIQLDSISGDGDTNTSITFSGSDVITIATGGSGRLTIGDGALSPVTDNQIDLGTSSLEFKDAFFDGTVTADAFAGPITGDLTGTLQTAAQTNITSLGALTALQGNGAPFTISNTNNGNNIDIKTTSSNSLVHAVKIHSGGVFEAKQGAVFNEDSNDVDFRVESNGNANMFFVDGGNDKVGIGTNSPNASFHNEASAVTNVHYDTAASTILEATENVVQITAADSGSNATALLLSNAPSSGDNKHWIFHHGGTSKSNRLDIGYGVSTGTGFDGRGDIAADLSIDVSGNFCVGTTSPAGKVTFNHDGDVGIWFQNDGTTKWNITNDTAGSPGGDSLWIGDHANDNGVYISNNGSSWQGISDERLKRNWTTLTGACDKLDTLTKVGTFERRGKTTGNWSSDKEVGLSAQEVEAILPEAVHTGEDIEFASDDKVTAVKGMSYEKLVPLLVKAIQELNTRLKAVE